MPLHVSSLSEAFATLLAPKGPGPKVDAHMVKRIARLLEVLSALGARNLLVWTARCLFEHIRLGYVLEHAVSFACVRSSLEG